MDKFPKENKSEIQKAILRIQIELLGPNSIEYGILVSCSNVMYLDLTNIHSLTMWAPYSEEKSKCCR